MRFERELSLKNLKQRPARTAALILLAAFLSLSIFGGSIIVMSLQNGLNSYEARLGADVVVVPGNARSRNTLDGILLQGIPGQFYMDNSILEKVSAREGVEAATPQFYLASVTASCCSTKVQIIGFDPETDFFIQPWIRRSYGGELGDLDLIVGYNVNIPTDGYLTFYNTKCRVVAQLDETGTGLDTAVYANMNTIRTMMNAALDLGYNHFDGINVDRAISAVMVKVADGYSAESVTNDINIHVRKADATQASTMVSSIAGGLSGVSGVIGALTVMLWIMSIAILVIAFVMIANERVKEFAVLRVMGASQKMLGRLLRLESAIISAVGAILGVAIAALVVFPFSSLIHSRLDLPYLLPGGGAIAALAVGSVLLAVLAGSLTSAISVRRITRNDTGLILREGA